MKTFFQLLVFTALLGLTQPALSEVPLEADPCGAYTEIASQLECSNRNYLLQFGYRYCQKYLQHENLFSPEGQAFLQRNRHCLIEKLTEQEGLTCENVKRRAYGHHVKCYVDMGFCELPKNDRKLVIQEIQKRHLLRPLNIITAFKILKTCHQRRERQ